MAFCRHEPISRHRSLQTRIFQTSDNTVPGTVEWASMADDRSSVFMPCYPTATTEAFGHFHAETAMPERAAERPAEGLYCGMEDGTWGICPDGWRDSQYWVFSMPEHIARDDEGAAVYIREGMDELQDTICASAVIGNPAAEKCRRAASELLSEYGRQNRAKIPVGRLSMTRRRKRLC